MEDDSLLPFKGCGLWVVDGDEVVNGLPELLRRGKAGALQCLSAQDAEPALHLIEPGRVSRDEMEVHILVALEPAIVFGLVGIEVIQNDMDLPTGVFADDLVHEIQKLTPSPPWIVPGLDQAGSDFERREQRRSSMALITMAEPVDGLTVGQSQISLCAFQCLNRRLFVYRQYQGVLRRIEVQPNHVSGLRTKFGIRTDTPTPSALEADIVLAENAPHLIPADTGQSFRNAVSVPLRVSFGGWFIEQPQDALFGCLAVLCRFPGSGGIAQTRQPTLRETLTPF